MGMEGSMRMGVALAVMLMGNVAAEAADTQVLTSKDPGCVKTSSRV
jgi:hypothetical protein